MFVNHWAIAYNVKATYNEKIHDGGAKKTTTICLTIWLLSGKKAYPFHVVTETYSFQYVVGIT